MPNIWVGVHTWETALARRLMAVSHCVTITIGFEADWSAVVCQKPTKAFPCYTATSCPVLEVVRDDAFSSGSVDWANTSQQKRRKIVVLHALSYDNSFTQLMGKNGELCTGTLECTSNMENFGICRHGVNCSKVVKYYGRRWNDGEWVNYCT